MEEALATGLKLDEAEENATSGHLAEKPEKAAGTTVELSSDELEETAPEGEGESEREVDPKHDRGKKPTKKSKKTVQLRALLSYLRHL